MAELTPNKYLGGGSGGGASEGIIICSSSLLPAPGTLIRMKSA